MNRETFLKNKDVAEFINWLIKTLPHLTVSLNIAESRRFVPNGVQETCSGIEEVLPHYSWMGTWADNKGHLGRLASDLRTALATGTEHDALMACLAILKWGGVRGAVSYLHAKAHAPAPSLKAYLNNRKHLFDLKGTQRLAHLDAATIDKFDAGMTKIYSLLDTTGSPIYDSRVGAAMAMLYQCHLRSSGKKRKPLLNFPSGPARGNQVRDPGALDAGFDSAPQFYTQVEPHVWAQFQLKLGWIIKEILSKTTWFKGEGPQIVDRSRAFEACLFMIGYDLNSIVDNACCKSTSAPTSLSTSPQTKEGARQARALTSRSTKWVPTVHPFKSVLEYFLAFRQSEQTSYSLTAFQDWLVANYVRQKGDRKTPIERSTATSYLFPLRVQEFDLEDRSIKDLESILEGGKPGLECAVQNRNLDVDERAWVCLVDAWIVGQLKPISREDQIKILKEAGFAGTTNACNHILYVGDKVGKHFGLLETDAHNKGKDGCITAFYKEFFAKQMVMDEELKELNRAKRIVLKK